MNVRTVRFLLLDFDGPVCGVFAGFPASRVADLLRTHLQPYAPQGWMADSSDPHAILRASIELGKDVAASAHQELAELELEAIKSAKPTPYAVDVIRDARKAGSAVAIVSNNAASAVVEYLSAANLSDEIDYVSARASGDVSLMKPNPHLVNQAMAALRAENEFAALVGDQVSDITAAHRAGIYAIGYANSNGKLNRFADAGADLVITSMAELL